MNGLGLLKGLIITIKHFFATYFADFLNKNKKKKRGSVDSEGLFTVEYPEQVLVPAEEFRVIPFLLYELGENGDKHYRCTSCGICAKVCPTQCIFITRKKDEVTGRPVPHPEAYYLDTDKCMNCGTCAEFCPFDAIKMDHDFELATYERGDTHIFDMAKLGKPVEYYAKIRPVNYAAEEAERLEKAKTAVN